jgi:serine/threonine protein kinase/tetratricopeptide (TPR) repeat protein
MPRTKGNAPPPDGNGRNASKTELTSGQDVGQPGAAHPDEPVRTRAEDRGADQNLDATILPIAGAANRDVDATILPIAGAANRDGEATILPTPRRSVPEIDATILPLGGSADDSDATILPVTRPPQAQGDDYTRLEPLTPRVNPPPQRPATAPPRPATGTNSKHQTGGTSSTGDSDEGPLAVGQPFGTRYHITRVLGVGGMGAVYQAWDAELGVDVAVKVIRPEIAADPEAASEIERRFKRELLLARQVTHPNIIRIHDIGTIDGIKYITMPFIDGSDLATILKDEKKLSVQKALQIARGTVAGLVSAHKAGVIHRDLKPANIMIDLDDTPTIMDFGIARSAGGPGQGKVPRAVQIRPSDLSRTAAAAASSTMAGAIVGTVAYMAPEQARGEPVDQRADIYAFGLILYDMLVGGRRAEHAPSAVAELQQRMQTAPPAPRSIDPSIPEALDAIIRRCLEPDLNKRFHTTGELQHALERLDENGMPLPIMKRVSRRVLIAASVAVALLLGGTFYVTRWMSAPVVEPDPVSVIIADLQNNTNDTAFNGTFEPMLRLALEGARFISAFDRNRIRAGLGVAPPENFNETAARELAVKQGVPVVLAGSIDSRGTGYEISMKAQHAVTGDVITSARRRADSKDQVLPAITEMMADVREALGDNTSESAQLFAMRSVSASSLEVVSLYADAVEAQSKGNYEAARESYLKAVQIDPKFGLGYQGLAVMSRNLTRMEDADKYIKEALRYLDSMTDRERFGTRGFYYRLIGDNQQCAKEYGELLVAYPADTVGHMQRGVCLAAMKNMREAVSEMQQAVKILPNHVGYRTNLATVTNFTGDFEQAEREVAAIPQPDFRALHALAYSQIGRGMLTEAAATYQKMASTGREGASIAAAGMADLAMYEGRYAEAIPILQRGIAADLEAKSMTRAAVKQAMIAFAHLAKGQNAPAVAAAEKALDYAKPLPVRFLAARVFVEGGELEKARAIGAELAAELPATPQAHGKIILGEVALKEKKAREAIRILTEANGLVDTWLGRYALGRAYLEAGDALIQADSEFDRCIARRGEALSLLDEGPTYSHLPMAYYYQGRVREGLGTAGFAESYRAYLRIRGKSTEDPLVADVQRRISN